MCVEICFYYALRIFSNSYYLKLPLRKNRERKRTRLLIILVLYACQSDFIRVRKMQFKKISDMLMNLQRK